MEIPFRSNISSLSAFSASCRTSVPFQPERFLRSLRGQRTSRWPRTRRSTTRPSCFSGSPRYRRRESTPTRCSARALTASGRIPGAASSIRRMGPIFRHSRCRAFCIEDTRYYGLGHGTIFRRSLYVISRQGIARTYGGRDTPNIAGLGGKVLTQVVSRTYYPTGATDFGTLATKFGYSVMRDVAFTSISRVLPYDRRALISANTARRCFGCKLSHKSMPECSGYLPAVHRTLCIWKTSAIGWARCQHAASVPLCTSSGET